MESLAPEWRRLWGLSPRPEIFGTFAWCRAWWRAFGSTYCLRVLVVFDSHRIAGLLPLISDGAHLKFMGTPHGDYNDLLCEPHEALGVLEAALRGIPSLLSTGDRCVLENLAEDSNIVSCFPRLPARIRKRLHLSFATACPRVVFDTGGGSVLSVILRKKSLRRHENSLRRLGELRFRHLEDRDEIKHHLPGLFQQHVARWAQAGGDSIFLREPSRNFYVCLVDELDPRTELRFAVLELDGRPIAYHFGFETNGTFLWYKPTFDPELSKFSPGEVLIKKLFEYAGARGVRVFDFTVGDESFKDRFANVTQDNYHLYVFPPGVLGGLHHRCRLAKDYLKRYQRVFGAAGMIATTPKRMWRSIVRRMRKGGQMACNGESVPGQ